MHFFRLAYCFHDVIIFTLGLCWACLPTPPFFNSKLLVMNPNCFPATIIFSVFLCALQLLHSVTQLGCVMPISYHDTFRWNTLILLFCINCISFHSKDHYNITMPTLFSTYCFCVVFCVMLLVRIFTVYIFFWEGFEFSFP